MGLFNLNLLLLLLLLMLTVLLLLLLLLWWSLLFNFSWLSLFLMTEVSLLCLSVPKRM